MVPLCYILPTDVQLSHGNPCMMCALLHTFVASSPLAQEMSGWMVEEKVDGGGDQHCLVLTSICMILL